MFQFFPKKELFESIGIRSVIRLPGSFSRLPAKILLWVMKVGRLLYKPAKQQGIKNPALLRTSIVFINPTLEMIRDLQAVPQPALFSSSLLFCWLWGLVNSRILPYLKALQLSGRALSRLHKKEHSSHQALVCYSAHKHTFFLFHCHFPPTTVWNIFFKGLLSSFFYMYTTHGTSYRTRVYRT